MIKPVLLIAYLMVCGWFLPVAAGADEALFEPYQRLLAQHLTEATTRGDGLVSAFDYEGALGAPQTGNLLSKQRERLADVDIDALEGKAEAVAFWINAYNFFMLDQILTERPDGKLVGSVWDYGGRVNPFVDSVFDRAEFRVDERDYSLNQIEKEILPPQD